MLYTKFFTDFGDCMTIIKDESVKLSKSPSPCHYSDNNKKCSEGFFF